MLHIPLMLLYTAMALPCLLPGVLHHMPTVHSTESQNELDRKILLRSTYDRTPPHQLQHG